MEKKIAFDIDGVLTENVYIPLAERTCERYHQLKPNQVVIDALNNLWSVGYEIYIISSRSCKTPKTCFYKWWWEQVQATLLERKNVYLGVPKKQKAYLASKLGCTMLFDDDMNVIEECNNTSVQGVLVDNKRYGSISRYNFLHQNPEQKITLPEKIIKVVDDYYKDTEPQSKVSTYGNSIVTSTGFDPITDKYFEFFKKYTIIP